MPTENDPGRKTELFFTWVMAPLRKDRYLTVFDHYLCVCLSVCLRPSSLPQCTEAIAFVTNNIWILTLSVHGV